MNTSPLSCIGYARVSTERQAGETHTSISDQKAAITALAHRLNTDVHAWYVDEGVSGSTVEQRPQFRALIAYCEEHRRSAREPGLVLVLNDSRFGRFPDPDEAAALRFRMKQAGWLVRFAESDDTEDITFRSVIRSLGSAQASEYRRNIQRNAKRGAKGSAEQGFWCREAPFGYRRQVVFPAGAARVLERGQLKAPNERVSLTPHEGEAAIVKWMYEAYAEGEESLGTLAQKLKRSVPGRKWSRTVVNHVLINPVYVGDIVGGRRPADKAERSVTPVRPESEWYGRPDAHPPLVTRPLYAAVQAKLTENRHRRSGNADYLLTGFLRCPHCSQHYTGGGTANQKPHVPRNRTHIYRDKGGMSRVCPGRIGTVMAHIVDHAVITTVGKALRTPAVQRRIEAEIDRLTQSFAPDADKALATLAAKERKLTDAKERLVEAIASGTLNHSDAAGQLERIRSEIEGVYRQRGEIRLATRKVTTAQGERDRLLSMALDFPSVASRLSGQKLRNVVLPWLAFATFDKATRELSLGINRVPSSASLLVTSQPGQAVHQQIRPFTRRVSLLQPGHEQIAAEYAAEIEREMRRRQA